MQSHKRLARLNSTALAAMLAAGCIAVPGFALAATAQGTIPGAQQVDRKADAMVRDAEKAAAKRPQDAGVRTRVGQSYLAAGRFVSAATSFEDAVSLGDKSPATALRLALSYIGAGRNAEATSLLGQWREAIPAGDFGLALALAGHPGEAVTILSEAIKQGGNSPKARQNLAYAFALDGRLHEARVVASQDVPLDQLDARISEWALQASVGSQQSRVAALLGAPVRSDPGQPAQLALASPASEAPALAALTAPEPAPQGGELPALAEPAPMVAQAAPEPAAERTPDLAEAGPSGLRFVSNPVIQDVRASPVARRVMRTAAAEPTPVAKTKAAAPLASSRMTSATHVVQLGSFTTEEGARRAWGIFVRRDPSLKDRELRITQAMVNGRRYFRVAAGGYDMASARSKCSQVRGGGRECLAYGTARELPGAVGTVARRLASR